MKIGIITVHDSANCGSYLQAFALKSVLQNMGHEVTFIKTRSNYKMRRVFMGSIKNIRKYVENYKDNKQKYKVFRKEVSRFKEINLKQVTESTFDVVIIGSDELWNVNTPVFRNGYFYGEGVPTKKKLAYAISCGNATKKDLESYPKLVSHIKSLNQVFVRDDSTRQNLESLVGRTFEDVCDPTFLIDVAAFDFEYENIIQEKYIMIYSYVFSDLQKEYIQRYAKEKDLKIVSVCLKHNWSDYFINCSPLQFCKVIQNAECVVTTTFHGTIFSILNKKAFISIPASQKVADVLKKTGLEDAEFDIRDGYTEFKKKLERKRDFQSVDEKIHEWRKKSLELLKKELDSM